MLFCGSYSFLRVQFDHCSSTWKESKTTTSLSNSSSSLLICYYKCKLCIWVYLVAFSCCTHHVQNCNSKTEIRINPCVSLHPPKNTSQKFTFAPFCSLESPDREEQFTAPYSELCFNLHTSMCCNYGYSCCSYFAFRHRIFPSWWQRRRLQLLLPEVVEAAARHRLEL